MILEKLYSGLLKRILIFLILSYMIVTASAVENSQLQWGTGISSKLIRGEMISYMGFSVKVTGFSAPVESSLYTQTPIEDVMPFVGLNISKNGTFINSIVLAQGDSYVDPGGELRITANELPAKDSSEWLFESYRPWVVLGLTPRGKPDIQVDINTDYDEYTSMSGADIVATVTVQNTGTADAIDVDMNIVTQFEIIRGELNYHFDKVLKGQSIAKEMVFSSPVVSKLKTYNIAANVSGFDIKGLPYEADFLKNIRIAPEGQPMPSLKKIANSKIYLKDSIMVSLTLKNNRKDELKNVSITDTLPKGFKLIGNNSLKWSANVAPNGEWNARYLLKPIEAIKEVLPSAKAEFTVNKEYFVIPSNRPEIIVYGPRIILTKKSDLSEIDPGENITVTIVARNDGNTPTKVMITDNLPNNSIVKNGSTYYEDYLEANKVANFSYTLKVDSNPPFKLPPATAQYYELGTDGVLLSTKSQELEIKIKPPPPTPTPIETPQVEATEQPLPTATAMPGIDQLAYKDLDVDINSILKILLGCDQNDQNNLDYPVAYDACIYFKGADKNTILAGSTAEATANNSISAKTSKKDRLAGARTDQKLVISNITAASGKSYSLDTLAIGKLLFSDRTYFLTNVPSQYAGLDYIKTSNIDRYNSDPNFLQFDVNKDVTVYVAYDDRITTRASWLKSSFIDTGNKLGRNDTVNYSIYSRIYPAGHVSLGGNSIPPGGSGGIYIVIVKPGKN